MSLATVKFLRSPSVRILQGTNTINLTGGVDAFNVYHGTVIFLGNNPPVEALSGTISDGFGNSTIELRYPWTLPSVIDEPLVAFNTNEGLPESIRRARSIGDLLLAILESQEELLTSTEPTIEIDIGGVATELVPYGYLVSQFKSKSDNLTLDQLLNNSEVTLGDIVSVSDRGFSKFKVVESATVTSNGIDIITCVYNPLLAVKLVNSPIVSLEAFGMVADDDSKGELNYHAIKRAFENNEITNLYLPQKKYTIQSQVAGETLLQVNRPVNLSGKGWLDFYCESEGSYLQAFQVNSDGVHIEGIEVSVDTSTSNSIVLSLNNGNGGSIKNCYLHGTNSDRPVHIVKVEDAAQCDDWVITGNKVRYCRFGIFSANLFGTNNNGGRAKNWVISKNTFIDFLNDPIELNSDNNEDIPADKPWSEVAITGNIFKNKLNGSSNIVIGGDGVGSISIAGNVISGVKNSANACIHIENASSSVAITGNTLKDVAAGIEVYPSDLSNEADYGNITITGNSVEGINGYTYTQTVLSIVQRSGNRVGISLVLDPTGSAHSAVVSGNTVRNFNVGIYTGSQQRDTLVHSNQISLCYEGLGVSSRLSQNVKNNNVEHCPNVFGVTGSNISLGSVNCKNCFRLFSNDLIETVRITNIRWSVYGNVLARPSFPPQVLTPVKIFELPTFFNGHFAIEIFKAGWVAYTDSVGWDGTELTNNNKLNEYGVSSIAVSGTPIATSTHNVEFNVYNGGNSSINNVDWTVEFTGYLFFV